MEEIEVSKDPYTESIKINLADEEKVNQFSSEKKAEENSINELDCRDSNLFSMDDSTVASGSAIDRSSLFEVNAAEKLNYFFYTNLTVQNKLPRSISASVCERAEILNKKETGPYPLTVQKYDSLSPLRPPIKTSSLDKIRQFMDQANHVQYMIGQFEKQIESSKLQNGQEKDNIEKKARERAMDQENENRVKKEFYKQQDKNSVIIKEVSISYGKQHQIKIKEDCILQGNNSICRRQTPCDSIHEDQKQLLCSPNLLQDVMFQENRVYAIHRPPDILEACTTSHKTTYKASQSSLQESGISSLPREEEKKKETVMPLNRISSSIFNQRLENKTFDVLRLKKTVVNHIVPSQKPSKWTILDKPDWRLTCQIMDKNENGIWNVPEVKDDLNRLWLDFSVLPYDLRLNWMSQRMRYGKEYILRQHQFMRKVLSEDMLWIPEGKCSCLFCVKQKQNFGSEPSRCREHGHKYIKPTTSSSINTLNDVSIKPRAMN
uniref:Uncharacterized protein LOC117355414 n=1 Tax=Geotrypetes seraphini TaxID=260995 RepID=A0A6P8QTF4_GEOSA|nr:uncharacterized protein LOC117355414 [Geotrypetes seraphini]